MQKKQGISLIVLVITIIVMIILAASVVITLSNTGVINRASQAVDLTNEAAVQDLAALTWADAYMDNLRGQDLINEVTTKLGEQGVTADKWNISVTDTGVIVTNKNSSSGTGLGSLIKGPEDYGKTVDYTVTVNGTTYTNWQIYYHNSDYVYLISKNNAGKLEDVADDESIKFEDLTSEELALYKKFQVGTWDKIILEESYDSEWMGGYTHYHILARLIRKYSNFANRTAYGSNVIGAIGGPTLELIAAGYNATIGEAKITPIVDLTYSGSHVYGCLGYMINTLGRTGISGLTNDGLYFSATNPYVVVSPNANEDATGPHYLFASENQMLGSCHFHSRADFMGEKYIRPVVCLKSSIPATVGTGDYDFSLVK